MKLSQKNHCIKITIKKLKPELPVNKQKPDCSTTDGHERLSFSLSLTGPQGSSESVTASRARLFLALCSTPIIVQVC